jgi:hypothetical protein
LKFDTEFATACNADSVEQNSLRQMPPDYRWLRQYVFRAVESSPSLAN